MGGTVKKITKPISKVLDKIVPNEIKPALPYLAAVAPFMLPAGFTIGGLSSQLSRAIASGAINLGSQAAQEGAAERGINPLSLALAAGTGYLSTPGSSQALEGMKTGIPSPGDTGLAGGELGFLDRAKNLGITGAQKTSEFLTKGTEASGRLFGPGEATLKDVATLGKAAVPNLIGAATEQSYNAALDAQKKYQQQLTDFNAMTGQTVESSNQQRRFFINQSMQGAGFGTDEINDTLRSLGLFAVGGRVGYEGGGDVSYTDYETSGVIYRDPEGNPISKEEFLRRTYEEEKKPKKKKVEKKMYGGRIGYQNGGLVSLIYSPIVAKRSIGVR
jgi:hypothetical protein